MHDLEPIGIIGLGYVGLPLALSFATKGSAVIGFDIDPKKIEKIERGESYFKHLASETLASATDSGKFTATTRFEKIAECKSIIICVPTPLNRNLEPDLSFIIKTCETIAPYVQENALVSLESTTWPGTTTEVVKPILEKSGKLQVGKNLFLAFSPEREDPGNTKFNTQTIPKLVGGVNPESLEKAIALYKKGIQNIVPVESAEVAESAKLLENIFRCVNIALVNELKVIFSKMNIDVWEVIRAASTKPFGFMPFWPGPGLGGHCIPIDPFYLTWKAREYGINTRFIELAGEINRSMPKWVVNRVQDCLNEFGKPLKGSKVLILGIAYKANIDDMRESPSLELIELLENKGAHVEFYDPMIPIIPQTREHAALADRKSVNPSSDFDCFLLATDHSFFDKENLLSYQVPIVDSRNFFPKNPLVFPA